MSPLSFLILLSTINLLLLTTMIFRLLAIMPSRTRHVRDPSLKGRPKTTTSHMLIVLGSGGHSREMLGLLRLLPAARWARRTYVASASDSFAFSRAREIEGNIQRFPLASITEPDTYAHSGMWTLKTVPRARNIYQPLITTPITSLKCLVACLQLLYGLGKEGGYPDYILVNGPATAVIVVVASLILKFLGVVPVWKMRSTYVESWARVNKLSLSGELVLRGGLTDGFVVQWSGLKAKLEDRGYKGIECFGTVAD